MPVKIRPPKKNQTLSSKITNQYGRLKTTWGRKRRLILSILIVSLVTTGSLSAALFYTRYGERQAWTLESEAFKLLHDDSSTAEEKEAGKRIERLTQAAKQYETLLDTYPSRKASALALYEAGHAYFELGKYDLAEAKYRAFIEKQPSHPLLPLVHLKLGHLYQKKKDTEAALKAIRMAYDGSSEKGASLNQDQAGFELARMLEQTEKKPEAIEIYKKISTASSESPWGMEAKARLVLLGESTGSTTPDMPMSPSAADASELMPAAQLTPSVPSEPSAVSAAPSIAVDQSRVLPSKKSSPSAPTPVPVPVLPSSEQGRTDSSAKQEGTRPGAATPPVTSTSDTPVVPVSPVESEPSLPAISSGESAISSESPQVPSASSDPSQNETPSHP